MGASYVFDGRIQTHDLCDAGAELSLTNCAMKPLRCDQVNFLGSSVPVKEMTREMFVKCA